jgi:hypothetical protein
MLIDWMDVLMTVLTTGVFALIGFVWRFSHKVTQMNQSQADLERRVRSMELEIDKTSDKLYSVVRSRSEMSNDRSRNS